MAPRVLTWSPHHTHAQPRGSLGLWPEHQLWPQTDQGFVQAPPTVDTSHCPSGVGFLISACV